MGGSASSEHTVAPIAADDPRAGGLAAPTLAELNQRNRARLARILLDGVASLTTASRSDEALRAYIVERLGEIDALVPSELQGAG